MKTAGSISSGHSLPAKLMLRKKTSKILTNYQLYLLLLPAVAYFSIFHYAPMYGIQLAFKDFIAKNGIWGSPWVGFKYFEIFFSSYYFRDLIKNTVGLSVYTLVAEFPMPILLALTLNEIRNRRYRKIVQTVTYAPHFISQVVMVGMLFLFLHPVHGPVNLLLGLFGLDPVNFMSEIKYFKHIYVWSGVWQQTGWGSIIYFAVLSSVDISQHEAAVIDGASRLQRIWYINIPVLIPTAVILFIMSSGRIMNVGFEKVYLMQTDVNQASTNVISTYVYRVGLLQARYSFSAAVGLFNSIINFILLVTVNKLSKRASGTSLW